MPSRKPRHNPFKQSHDPQEWIHPQAVAKVDDADPKCNCPRGWPRMPSKISFTVAMQIKSCPVHGNGKK